MLMIETQEGNGENDAVMIRKTKTGVELDCGFDDKRTIARQQSGCPNYAKWAVAHPVPTDVDIPRFCYNSAPFVLLNHT